MTRQAAPRSEGQAPPSNELMALVLDGYAGPDGGAESLALRCGLLQDANDRPCYTVMVSALLKEDGSFDTPASFASSVDRLIAKYLRGGSFFSLNKVVSVLSGSPADFGEFLYILADEITQMSGRALGRRCRVGVSRMSNAPASLAATGKPWRLSSRGTGPRRAPSSSATWSRR